MTKQRGNQSNVTTSGQREFDAEAAKLAGLQAQFQMGFSLADSPLAEAEEVCASVKLPAITRPTKPEEQVDNAAVRRYRRAERRVQAQNKLIDARVGDQNERLAADLTRLDSAKGELGKFIFGQDHVLDRVIEVARSYRRGLRFANRPTHAVVIDGIHATGKSKIAELLGEYMGWPVATQNAQGYLDKDANCRSKLTKETNKRGPRILRIDEIDKLRARRPGENEHPAMSAICDLLDGLEEFENCPSLVILTLNLPDTVYGELEAHPDLTSIADIIRVHDSELGSDAAKIHHYTRMFRRNTVSRLIPRSVSTRPLNESSFEKIIHREVAQNFRKLSPRPAAYEFAATHEFLDFLKRECIVPSEQARGTEIPIGNIISNAFAAAEKHLGDPYVKMPKLLFAFDYDRSQGDVLVTFGPAEKPQGQSKHRGITVRYHPMHRFELIPLRQDELPSRRQMYTAVHEWGHIMAGVRFGLPLEFARNEPIPGAMAAFAKFLAWDPNKCENSARYLFATAMRTLASRSMERIVYGNDDGTAKGRGKSYLQLTSGSSQDVIDATELITSMFTDLGLHPDFGAQVLGIDFTENDLTPRLPDKLMEDVRTIVRNMEDYLVKDFLDAHSREDYISFAETLARQKKMTEPEIFALLGYDYAPSTEPYHDFKRATLFGDRVEASETLRNALRMRQGNPGSSASENLDKAISECIPWAKDVYSAKSNGRASGKRTTSKAASNGHATTPRASKNGNGAPTRPPGGRAREML